MIAQRAKYDVDDGSWEAGRLPSLTAHEIAHYYWGGDEDWIDEGAATFMEFIVENARTGAPLTADKYPCAVFATLGEVDRKNPQHPSDGGPWKEFRCNYSLGERLFLDLYRTLGQEQFREGFRNLYLASKGRGSYAGIAEVEAAFKQDAAPEVATAVDTVINQRYHGTEPYDLTHLDTQQVDPNLPSIDGRITDAFISLDQEWPVDVGSGTTRLTMAELDGINGWAYLYLRFGMPPHHRRKNHSPDIRAVLRGWRDLRQKGNNSHVQTVLDEGVVEDQHWLQLEPAMGHGQVRRDGVRRGAEGGPGGV